MPQHEHDRSEFEYAPTRNPIKGPVGARIEELKVTTLTAIRLTMPGHAVFPDAPVVEALGAALEALHAQFPRCEECESARYRNGKADGIAEVMNLLRIDAGALFADGQDNEARYLRDRIAPLKEKWKEEIAQVEYLNTRRGHTCSLDGLQKERD